MKKLWIVALVFTLQLYAQKNEKALYWPPPPEKARIAYVKSISKAQDLDIKKGFFAKIWDFFAGSEEKKLIKPFGIHFNDKKLYITDIGAKALFIFDLKNKKLKTIDVKKEFRFISPIDVTTDKRDNIYVTDSVQKVVIVLDKNGKFIRKIGEKRLKRPTGIAYNKEKDLILISDTLASKIKVFTPKGEYKSFIGGPGNKNGEFNRPTFINFDDKGFLYVSDSMNHRVQIFDKKGKFVKKFGSLGNTIGSFSNPRGLAVDKYGNIYITDTLFHAVQIFDNQGNILMSFGSYGQKAGEFAMPEDIEITKEGFVYVTDSYNMRVQVFKILDYK